MKAETFNHLSGKMHDSFYQLINASNDFENEMIGLFRENDKLKRENERYVACLRDDTDIVRQLLEENDRLRKHYREIVTRLHVAESDLMDYVGQYDPTDAKVIELEKQNHMLYTRYVQVMAEAEELREQLDSTCHNMASNTSVFTCSECECDIDTTDSYGEPTVWHREGVAIVPKYCPNCGRRVVE